MSLTPNIHCSFLSFSRTLHLICINLFTNDTGMSRVYVASNKIHLKLLVYVHTIAMPHRITKERTSKGLLKFSRPLESTVFFPHLHYSFIATGIRRFFSPASSFALKLWIVLLQIQPNSLKNNFLQSAVPEHFTPS